MCEMAPVSRPRPMAIVSGGWLWSAIALLAVGLCSSCAGTQPAPGSQAELILDAMRIGRTMYMHDLWAARATDALRSQLSPEGPQPAGWVTEEDGSVGT